MNILIFKNIIFDKKLCFKKTKYPCVYDKLCNNIMTTILLLQKFRIKEVKTAIIHYLGQF